MRAFTSTELERMQDTQVAAMQDRCKIGAYSSDADGYGNPQAEYTYGDEIECGVMHLKPREAQASGEVPVIDAALRLSIETVIDERDRIKVIKRFGELLDVPQVFEIEGPARRGPSGLVLDLRLVDDGTG